MMQISVPTSNQTWQLEIPFNRKMVELNGSIIGGLSIAMVDYQNVQRGKLNPTHTFLSFLWLLAFLGKGITMDPNFNPPTSSMPPWSPRSPTLPPTCAPRICPKSSLARDSREPWSNLNWHISAATLWILAGHHHHRDYYGTPDFHL